MRNVFPFHYNLDIQKRSKKKFNHWIAFIVLLFFSIPASAQCAMCRAALEAEGNSSKAEAVNDGIVYLMVIPYLLVALVGIAVYRIYRKKKA